MNLQIAAARLGFYNQLVHSHNLLGRLLKKRIKFIIFYHYFVGRSIVVYHVAELRDYKIASIL